MKSTILTDEQKRIKRNEYAKAYYAKNKANKKSKNIDKKYCNIEKQADKIINKYQKINSKITTLLSDVSSLLEETYALNDTKFINKIEKLICKPFKFILEEDIEKPKKYITLSKTMHFKIPKHLKNNTLKSESDIIEESDNNINELSNEICVDPMMLQSYESGDMSKDEFNDNIQSNEFDNNFDDEESDDYDRDEFDDEESDDYNRDEFDDDFDDYANGREEFMREYESMGVGEEDL